jgi:hypothetical protein
MTMTGILRSPHAFGRLSPSVTSDNFQVFVRQHRIDIAEMLDAIDDLADLLLGMGTGIASRTFQVVQRDHRNGPRQAR